MDYLPGQYGMHYERIGLNDYHYDSLGLTGHRPYYAFSANQLATGEQSSNGNYYWMQQQHSGQHLVGQKQYELTNHLGNVQVTVSDLPYKHGNDTMTHISPALKAVYDYYPFGSPMPGRTIMDTARKCVDRTRLDRVWKAWEMTMTEIYALSLINYHLDGEGEVFIDDNGAVEVETADEHAVFYMDLQDSLNNGGEMVLHVDWLKEFSEKGFLLTLQGMDVTGEMRVFYQKHYKNPEDAVYLSIADSFTNISVGIQGNVHFRLDNIRYAGGSWVNEEVLVRVCDDGGDRYRFGFNGQEKVNEISGMGNHNTAEFWEYDTRLGRRWNLDPVDQISVSNYAVNGNNPIVNIDPLGDIFNKWDTKSTKKKYKFNNYYNTNTKHFADEANLESFKTALHELAMTNIIFPQVYVQLLKSKNLYIIQQEYTNTANYKRNTKTINMKYRGVGKDAYISITEVFEEVFHAGQDEFYSARGIKRSNLENEVEAKVADIISGFQDDAVNKEYNSIKNYFQTGKKDKGFDSELNTLIKDVDKLYNNYDNTEGKQWRKNNDPKKVDKNNVLKYLETLIFTIENN